MKNRIWLILTLCLSVSTLKAQNNNVLFTYGKNPVELNEFKRVFFKNNDSTKVSRDTASDYLNLFIYFKLKVQDAIDHGMDTTAEFKAELEQYRKQLAQPYMQDKEVTESIIDEAYQHKIDEVRASHLLIKVGPYDLPKDTLEAYNKIMGLRARAIKGENFDSLAKKYSEDPSAQENFGDLGYFSAFDMIYSFEQAAYSSNVGELSMPVRTRFGYHILKVTDRRKARGENRVAHIMVRLDALATDAQILRGKEKADSIYQLIQTGKISFDEAVKQFSDDYPTKEKNGEVGWIASTNRQMPIEFREATFSLKNIGDMSKPVKTKFGWHIVKLLEHKGLPAKKDVYESIKSEIYAVNDDRANANRKAMIEKIKKEYNYTANNKNLQAMLKKADTTLTNGKWDAAKITTTKPLFTLGNNTYTQAQFSNYLSSYQTAQNTASPAGLMERMYSDFVDKEAWEYEENNLPNKYEKFKNLLTEYYEGILLFNHTQKTIWDKAIQDTTGLKEFYENNKSKYQWKERIDATVYECTDEKTAKNVLKLLKKGNDDTAVSRIIHEQNKLGLNIKFGRYQKGDNANADLANWTKTGIQNIGKTGDKYIIVNVKEILPAGPKLLNETRGLVISDYQMKLEKEWLDGLRLKYPVTINEVVWNNFLKTLTR